MFLAIVILHIAVSLILGSTGWASGLDVLGNFALSDSLILFPALAALFVGTRERNVGDFLGFHRIKLSSAALTVLFAFLMMPLTVVLNAISMFLVDNRVLELSPQILDKPFWTMFLSIAVVAPFVEELVFRGAVYQGYRKAGGARRAVLWSALLFALMHMNFNQALYALVMGIFLALLAEAAGSLWASFLCHFVFNGWSVCLMFLTKNWMPAAEAEAAAAGQESMGMAMAAVISVFAVIAAGATALAVCVLAKIGFLEGRTEELKAAVSGRARGNGRLMSLPLLGAVVLAVGYMILAEL